VVLLSRVARFGAASSCHLGRDVVHRCSGFHAGWWEPGFSHLAGAAGRRSCHFLCTGPAPCGGGRPGCPSYGKLARGTQDIGKECMGRTISGVFFC